MRTLQGHGDLVSPCGHGRAMVVRLLLQQGAEMNARTGGGDTTLYLAAVSGQNHVAKVLMQQFRAGHNITDNAETNLVQLCGHCKPWWPVPRTAQLCQGHCRCGEACFEHLSRNAVSAYSIRCKIYFSSLPLRVLASALLLSPSGQRLQESSEERAGSTT